MGRVYSGINLLIFMNWVLLKDLLPLKKAKMQKTHPLFLLEMRCLI